MRRTVGIIFIVFFVIGEREVEHSENLREIG